jgi:glutathione-independent formaldehyde dehydrogenase
VRAAVYHGPHKVAVEDVADPKIEAPLDAVIRITTANICGSDLHPYEGRAEAPDAYDSFDKRLDGWTKVLLHPGA